MFLLFLFLMLTTHAFISPLPINRYISIKLYVDFYCYYYWQSINTYLETTTTTNRIEKQTKSIVRFFLTIQLLFDSAPYVILRHTNAYYIQFNNKLSARQMQTTRNLFSPFSLSLCHFVKKVSTYKPNQERWTKT